VYKRQFYDGSGLGVRAVDPDYLNEAVLDLLNKPAVESAAAHDRALGTMIDAEHRNTFSMSDDGVPEMLGQLARTLAAELNTNAASEADVRTA